MLADFFTVPTYYDDQPAILVLQKNKPLAERRPRDHRVETLKRKKEGAELSDLNINLHLGSFPQDNIKVFVQDNHVIIEGKHESGDFTSSFKRKIPLPPNVLPSSIQCKINPQGELQITAVPVKPTETIPIQIEVVKDKEKQEEEEIKKKGYHIENVPE